MGMKINISLSLKITIIIIIVSAITIASVTWANIYYLEEQFSDASYQKGNVLIQRLNATIGGADELEDKDALLNKINGLISHSDNQDNKILKININLPDKQNQLMVFASTDNKSIGNPSLPY